MTIFETARSIELRKELQTIQEEIANLEKQIALSEQLPINQVLLGDCIELMKSLPDGCIDALISDPPYGTTQLKWDKAFDLSEFWKEAHRVCKENAAIVLFGSQPFTTDLIVSNRKNFRYSLIWQKTCPTGFLDANRKPLKIHEDISVFYGKQPTYNPQKTKGKPYKQKRSSANHYNKVESIPTINTGDRYPTSILTYSLVKTDKGYHPTQKPVDLMRWLVRTYTNHGDIVLDPYCGSGSTALAAKLENRNFITTELNEDYYAIATKRLNEDTP